MAEKLHVAIIGGGLCGLALANALTRRSISHTIYESRSSFTEIGAGINLGPNTMEAFSLIDPEFIDTIHPLATKNPPGQDDVWMNIRLWAPAGDYEDAHLVHQIRTGLGVGNMTVSRNGLLQALAKRIKPENARFNKKLVDIEQCEDYATVVFEDGTRDRASVVVACDGAHSTARRILLGADHPATTAKWSHTGGYRAVFPRIKFEEMVGEDQAGVTTVRLGPDCYVISYPIDSGNNVNVGLWPRKNEPWTKDSWVVPNQKQEMQNDFKDAGPTIHRIMAGMSDDTAFWATFYHATTPESYCKGRVCIIGDAAHAMCPHEGQGASQAMEDACVIADVLSAVNALQSGPSLRTIEAALSGYQDVRRLRFEKALQTSIEAFSFWGGFWRQDLSAEQVNEFNRKADDRMLWAWHAKLDEQCKEARTKMSSLLAEGAGAQSK